MPATPLPAATDVTPSIPRFAVIAPATKLPVASRLTMVLAASAFVGATVQFRPRVPAPVTGEPVTLKSEEGALSATLVIFPVPGKACPGAKLIVPLALNEKPVLVAPALVEDSRFNVAEGAAVLLPVTAACHSKRGFTAALL